MCSRLDDGLCGSTITCVEARPAFDELFQLVGIRRTLHGNIERDLSLVNEGRKRLVEGLHSELVLPRLHHRVDLVDLVLADQVSNSRVRHQDLEGHHAAVTGGLRQKGLAHDPFENERKLCPNL